MVAKKSSKKDVIAREVTAVRVITEVGVGPAIGGEGLPAGLPEGAAEC